MGPTGSGKSQLAKHIFELKKNRRKIEGELVEVNCATIHGRCQRSTGMLRKANGGVLFLDEIGELALDEQGMLLRAIEEKSFYPVGSDREVRSEFQLLAGTNRELGADVVAGRFREDLLARINLWSFRLPGLRERPEDIEPNLSYELEQCSRAMNAQISFSREAREQFLAFATSSDALWAGNFRDFIAAIRRMATLCTGGRISVDDVTEEVERLRSAWRYAGHPSQRPRTDERGELVVRYLGAEKARELDEFARVLLDDVLRVCGESPSLSEAGRRLFNVSRAQKKTANDADRLQKYLARFGLA